MRPYLGPLIALAIAIAIAVLIILITDSQGDDARAETAAQIYPADIPLDAMLLHLDKRALDAAYSDRLEKLFAVWLSSQSGDPTQFTNGLRITRRAYNHAMQQIVKREQKLLEEQR